MNRLHDLRVILHRRRLLLFMPWPTALDDRPCGCQSWHWTCDDHYTPDWTPVRTRNQP
jgi:hypothetical protein